MTGALILLAVLVAVAWHIRPRRYVPRNRRNRRKLFDWLHDDGEPPE